MRARHVFRPTSVDSLEGRVVPSRAPMSIPILIETAVPLPPQIQKLDAVRAAFNNFLQQYTQTYNAAYFPTTTPTATANPTVTQQAFNVQVKSELVTLDAALTTAVATQPTATQLSDQIDTEVLGSGPNSLESLLIGLPSPFTTAAANLTTTQAVAPSTASTSLHAATTDLRSVTLPLVAQGGPITVGGTTSDDVTTTTPSANTPQAVRSAFSTFLNSYSAAVQKVLLAPGPDGTVNPAANRPAFDAEVAEAVKILNSSVRSAIGALPSSAALATKAQSAIVGAADSLQAKLSALPTPGSGQPAAVAPFGDSSTQAVGGVLSLLMGDVSAYLRGIAGQ